MVFGLCLDIPLERIITKYHIINYTEINSNNMAKLIYYLIQVGHG